MYEAANELFGGVTAGGTGVEEGKIDEACMAENRNCDVNFTHPFRNDPANDCVEPELNWP